MLPIFLLWAAPWAHALESGSAKDSGEFRYRGIREARLAPGLPPIFDEVVRRSLEPEPSFRFHSAAEMAAALG